MSVFKGTIAKKPVVKEKVIFSAIKMDGAAKPTQLVLFKSNQNTKYIDTLSNAELGDTVTVLGKTQQNKLNNETEIIIAEVYDGNHTKEVDQYSINPDTDYVVGGTTKYGEIKLIERVDKEPYYTDGEMYWYSNSTTKTPCNF